MSELKTNKVTPATGTSITLGDSGDTFTLPSGATLSGAGAITVPSGGSLTINSGATITNNGTNGGGFGKVLQVLNAIKTDSASTSSNSYVDVSGLSVSITPSSASSKILVLVNLNIGHSANTQNSHYRLVRDSTAIANGTDGYFGNTAGQDYFAPHGVGINYLDSPATTSATTYKIQFKLNTGSYTAYVNARGYDGTMITSSAITVMEIAA